MRWTGIANAAAGPTPTDIGQLRQAATDTGLDAEFHETESIDEMRRIVSHAIDHGGRAFLAVGGDGTTHHLVNAMLASRRTSIAPCERLALGLVPCGSGSDLARTFALPSDPRTALGRLTTATAYPIDIGRINVGGVGRYFVNATNIGVAAGAVAVANKLPRRLGKTKYVTAFWLHLASAPIADLDIAIDHHRFEGRAINVVIANGQFFGGGLNIAPRATMNDGIFDVQVFQGPKRRAFGVMPRVIKGGHLTHPSVRRYVGATVAVKAPESLPVEADGELVGHGSATVEMLSAAVDLYV